MFVVHKQPHTVYLIAIEPSRSETGAQASEMFFQVTVKADASTEAEALADVMFSSARSFRPLMLWRSVAKS
jgi:hypothetical protein